MNIKRFYSRFIFHHTPILPSTFLFSGKVKGDIIPEKIIKQAYESEHESKTKHGEELEHISVEYFLILQ